VTHERFILQTRVIFAVVGSALPPAIVGNCLYLPHEKRNEVEIIAAISADRKHDYIYSFVPCKSLFELNVWV
jgi:hypothetical protein